MEAQRITILISPLGTCQCPLWNRNTWGCALKLVFFVKIVFFYEIIQGFNDLWTLLQEVIS